MTNQELAAIWQTYAGRTVRWDCAPTAAQTGIGGCGTVLGAVACESTHLRWVRVDIRTPDGGCSSKEPSQLRVQK